MFSFWRIINSSVTTGLIISAVMSSKTINTLRFSPGFCPSIFYEHLGHQMSSQKKKKI